MGKTPRPVRRPTGVRAARGRARGHPQARPVRGAALPPNFSWLDGASHPEELVEEAQRLKLDAIAITDHDGMYGVVRFAEAAKELGMHTVFGAELSIGLSRPANGEPDPEGDHLLLLARKQDGYHGLCRTLTTGHLDDNAEKGKPVYDIDQIVADTKGDVVVLTGCRKGTVRRALVREGPEAAFEEIVRLTDLFGRGRVYVELTDHGLPEDSRRNDILNAMAQKLQLPVVATNAVHYATPSRGRLAAAMAAVRARSSLDDMAGWLPPSPAAFLRSGEEMFHRFRRFPGAVHNAALLGMQLAFDLRLVAPKLPPFDVPDGHTEISWLRELTYEGARRRYPDDNEKAFRQIEHELRIIEQLGFPGYFLVVHDIVDFCKRNDILCQGRGSAANSAVCFALGITNVDAVRFDLLFERFLAPARDGPPDIDVDIESDRREEVIQHVYAKYDRRHAAQVANVITYRARSAVRDMARALGHSPGQQDAWSKQIDRWGPLGTTTDDCDIPDDVLELSAQLENFPRHLGIHSGGMVICDRAVSEVCPVEKARMDKRTVLQWDKDDCASIGLVKFDLLGLGMLSALHYAIDLVRDHEGVDVDMGSVNLADPAVYDMLQKADSVGVFQVESRAQMATLPRLKPRKFYDLVVEVALIRPGPIQGGSVHPYIRRRNEVEKWDYDHPLLENALKKTYGVPLFQEQLMQIAVDVAGFTAAEADELRRAMGAKRSTARMERLRDRFYEGCAANDIGEELALPHLREAPGVRQLRLPRVARPVVRAPGVRERVVQALLPGGVLRGPAQGPADGLLLAAVAGDRRPPPRRDGAQPVREPVASLGGSGTVRGQELRPHRAVRRPGHRRRGRGANRCRATVPRHGGLWHPRAAHSGSGGSPGHRRCLLLLRPGTPRGALGGRSGGRHQVRSPARHRGRRRRARVARHGRRRTGGGGRLGHGPVPGQLPYQVRAVHFGLDGRAAGDHPRIRRTRHARADRRRGDAPPTAA